MSIDKHINTLLNSVNDGIYILDNNRKIIFWNKSAESITGFTEEEVIGKSCSDNILQHIDQDGNQLCKSSCPMLLSINNKQIIESDVYLHHKEGYRLLVHIKGIPWLTNGTQTGAIEIFHPIVYHQHKMKQDLIALALIDPLTGVFNRRGFESIYYPRYLEMKVASPYTGVLFFDIDNFKKLNDTYGHNCGDAVLKTVAHTFTHNVRKYDIVARWGGEEFVIILFTEHQHSIVPIAKNLCTLIENAFLEHKGTIITFTVSCGTTLLHDNEHINSALSRADQLMYIAKNNGKNQVYHDIT